MAEMAAAAPAQNFGSIHEETMIGVRDECVRERPEEARPAGSAVELGRGAEQWKQASGADKSAAAMLIIEWTGERPLGPGFAQDVVPLRAEQVPPFSRRMGDIKPCACFT
jgi:hypothetical protein